MMKFFIYNSANTRDKKLLGMALDEGIKMQCIDLNQGLEQQLVGYIGKIPPNFLAAMLDQRVVESNTLDDNLKLIRFIEERPHIVKTPIILSEKEVIRVASKEDIFSREFAA